jgi:hypothetical protein
MYPTSYSRDPLLESESLFSSWPGIAVRRAASLPLAYVPAIHVFDLNAAKTWMPGIADKFTQTEQGRLLWPAMTSLSRAFPTSGAASFETLRDAPQDEVQDPY